MCKVYNIVIANGRNKIEYGCDSSNDGYWCCGEDAGTLVVMTVCCMSITSWLRNVKVLTIIAVIILL